MKVLILNPPARGIRFSRDGRCQSEENTWLVGEGKRPEIRLFLFFNLFLLILSCS